MIKYIIAASIAVASVNTAQANIFSDTLDAITGHANDAIDRFAHQGEFIEGKELDKAEFRDDDIGRDFAHWTNGHVSLVQAADGLYIQMESDFDNGLAPDLYVYVAKQKVVDEGTFWRSAPVEVAKLQSGSGGQYYKLPEGFSKWDDIEVIIWCKRFGAFMGAATL